MNGYGYGMDSGGFGWIGMLLFMVVVIVGLVVLVRALNQGSHGGHAGSVFDTDRTLQIARERFARGELTKEQFEALKRDLGH
ncbi:SHOCT domain-containing protein [Deinococcus sp. SM5_A1]|uniref:SHOCT domain-containing protein n=1 Tax=Deinococcus sp. SM5_A1 TaxID=3379094 RepID=UPI00385F9886